MERGQEIALVASDTMNAVTRHARPRKRFACAEQQHVDGDGRRRQRGVDELLDASDHHALAQSRGVEVSVGQKQNRAPAARIGRQRAKRIRCRLQRRDQVRMAEGARWQHADPIP
jgi:hypothetical protein